MDGLAVAFAFFVQMACAEVEYALLGKVATPAKVTTLFTMALKYVSTVTMVLLCVASASIASIVPLISFKRMSCALLDGHH